MILISHRGNLNGRMTEKENHPDYVDEAINLGYDVEIDIWVVDGYIFLGHDYPDYKIDMSWLESRLDKLWIHCKNIESLIHFRNIAEWSRFSDFFNYFWHDTDLVTLTSHNYIWAYPGNQPIKNSIAALPEIYNEDVSNCLGICSDKIQSYGEEIK